MKVRLPYKRCGLGVNVLLALALACVVTLAVVILQPNDVRDTLAVFAARPIAAVWNVVPVFLLILAGMFLFNNVFLSTALVGAVCLVFSLINRLKIEIRDEPLQFTDIALWREGMEAARSYHIDWPVALVAGVVLVVVVFLVLAACLGMKKQRWFVRAGGTLLPVVVLALLVNTAIADRHVYDNIEISNNAYMPTIYNERGYIYSFFHYITTYKVEEPAGYDKAEAAAWDEAQPAAGEAAPVNVVFIQNEAFSDISDWEGFAFAEGDDPLTHFHALASGPHALSGHIVVPQFAGGTANTEFDVLTGMQTIHAASSAFRTVHHDVGSIFRVFNADDYATSMFHPGEAWFYNRENVYRWFGSEENLFKEDMPGLAEAGGWVLDDALADRIIQAIDTETADGGLLFNESVTIQNHMSYTADKYGAGVTFEDVPLSVEMSEADQEMLDVYMKGVRDADAMIAKLTDTYRDSETPVVFVFYGDHLPYLGDNQSVYKALGKDFTATGTTTAESLEAFETPYLIWANDAAADAIDWDTQAAEMQLPETISACYLGASVLELVGRAGEDPWFGYLCDLRDQYPVMTADAVMTSDGTLTAIDSLDEAAMAPLEKYWQWAYYRLEDDRPSD